MRGSDPGWSESSCGRSACRWAGPPGTRSTRRATWGLDWRISSCPSPARGPPIGAIPGSRSPDRSSAVCSRRSSTGSGGRREARPGPRSGHDQLAHHRVRPQRQRGRVGAEGVSPDLSPAGLVEHDAREIWATQLHTAKDAVARAGLTAADIAAIGITNQRETTVVWDRATGEPVHHAIVWQDRRTAARCDQLKARGLAPLIKRKTGLVVDAYFSGTKLEWLLRNVPGARGKANAGRLAFGTVDSWLVWNLTGGRVHVTDPSNASRTMLFNLRTGD